MPQLFTLSSQPQISKVKRQFRLLLAFGSNMGHREQNLIEALNYIRNSSEIVASSTWRKTDPLKSPLYDTSKHEYYINFVAEVLTNFSPHDFYNNVIVKIENKLGHSREKKWDSRFLDIDILFATKNDAFCFQDCTPITINENNFIVPHTEYFNRPFWREMVEVELKYVPKR